MKKSFLLLAATALAVLPLSARTWTSSDGSKTFEGDLKTYDAAGAKVTVNLANGTTMTFPEDKLSAADRQWLKEQAQKPAESTGSSPTAAATGDVAAQLAQQKIGSKLGKVLSKIEGKKYKDYKLEKAPEYYIVYFSASW